MITPVPLVTNRFFHVQVPDPSPVEVLMGKTNRTRRLKVTAGSFVDLYKTGGSAHRKFQAVVTCFFFDTGYNLVDYIETIDSILEYGGVWVNIGPLKYRKSMKAKLAWKDIEEIWVSMGYEFLHSSRVSSTYNFPEGRKLANVLYDAVFTVSRKGRRT